MPSSEEMPSVYFEENTTPSRPWHPRPKSAALDIANITMELDGPVDSDMNIAPDLPFSAFSLSLREAGEDHACLTEHLRDILAEIKLQMQNPETTGKKMTLERIQIAVQICRTLNYSELARTVGPVIDSQAKETSALLTER